MGKKNLETLWSKGTDFLGVEYAIMGGAMSWISESSLVSAISNAGGFGVLACGAMPTELLRQEIKKTKEKTSKPFGVNLIVMHPDLIDLVNLCVEEKVTHVVLAGGLPSAEVFKILNENNIKSMAFAPNLALAKRLIRNGVSGLIIEGSEAGGHIGPVSTSVLIQEILLNVSDVPIFVAGGIGRGEMAVNYLDLGAAGVQMGTIFVCSDECIAHDKFKESFIRASAREAQPTVQIDNDFPVIPVRAIINNGTKEFMELQKVVIQEFKEGLCSKHDAQMKIELYWAGALKKAVIDGDVENGSLMAGQSVGLVNSIRSINDIMKEFVAQAESYLESLYK